MKKSLILLLIIGLVFSIVGCSKDKEEDTKKVLNQDLVNLMPSENFKWAYIGPSEYYHEMTIDTITVSEHKSVYKISGTVEANSTDEDPESYNIDLTYEIDGNSIKQIKNADRMLDSEYDSITLIKSPLEKGTSWSEEVKDSKGKTHTIKAEITKVTESPDGRSYEVVYKNASTGYTESRKIMEKLGVIAFSKAIIIDDATYQYGYGLYGRKSGYVTASDDDAAVDTGSEDDVDVDLNEDDDTTDEATNEDETDQDTDGDTDQGSTNDNSNEETNTNDTTTEPEDKDDEVDEALEVEKSIRAFNNAWIEYVNNDDASFFDHVIKNGVAYNNAKNFERTGLKETFLNMNISGINVNGNVATAKVYEEIKKEKDGDVTISKYNWLYDLVKRDGRWYINGYKFQ